MFAIPFALQVLFPTLFPDISSYWQYFLDLCILCMNYSRTPFQDCLNSILGIITIHLQSEFSGIFYLQEPFRIKLEQNSYSWRYQNVNPTLASSLIILPPNRSKISNDFYITESNGFILVFVLIVLLDSFLFVEKHCLLYFLLTLQPFFFASVAGLSRCLVIAMPSYHSNPSPTYPFQILQLPETICMSLTLPTWPLSLLSILLRNILKNIP